MLSYSVQIPGPFPESVRPYSCWAPPRRHWWKAARFIHWQELRLALLFNRIRWNKCDLDLYKSVVSASLSRIPTDVECTLDADLLVKSLPSSLRRALRLLALNLKKKKSGKGLPIWNDSIAVHASKEARVLWKKSGSLADPTAFSSRREGKFVNHWRRPCDSHSINRDRRSGYSHGC